MNTPNDLKEYFCREIFGNLPRFNTVVDAIDNGYLKIKVKNRLNQYTLTKSKINKVVNKLIRVNELIKCDLIGQELDGYISSTGWTYIDFVTEDRFYEEILGDKDVDIFKNGEDFLTDYALEKINN